MRCRSPCSASTLRAIVARRTLICRRIRTSSAWIAGVLSPTRPTSPISASLAGLFATEGHSIRRDDYIKDLRSTIADAPPSRRNAADDSSLHHRVNATQRHRDFRRCDHSDRLRCCWYADRRELDVLARSVTVRRCKARIGRHHCVASTRRVLGATTSSGHRRTISGRECQSKANEVGQRLLVIPGIVPDRPFLFLAPTEIFDVDARYAMKKHERLAPALVHKGHIRSIEAPTEDEILVHTGAVHRQGSYMVSAHAQMGQHGRRESQFFG